MNFFNEKNVAIVLFSNSSLLALTLDSSSNNSINSNQQNITTYSVKMKHFNPSIQNQHFFIRSTMPKNIFFDSFLIIESISNPGFYLNYQNDTIYVSNQNSTKWQFIDGHFTSNNGQKFLFFDRHFFSLKVVDCHFFGSQNPNDSNFNSLKLVKTNQQSTFHLCFYDGNSIPSDVPIIFYSPQLKKVLTINEEDMKYFIQMDDFDLHSSSQVFVFNAERNKEISSTKFPKQYLCLNQSISETDIYKVQINNILSYYDRWSYMNFRLMNKDYKSFIKFNKKSNELYINDSKKDILIKKNKIRLIHIIIIFRMIISIKSVHSNKEKIGSFSFPLINILYKNVEIDTDDVFYIILSNQRELFNYVQNLSNAYLYVPICHDKFTKYPIEINVENENKNINFVLSFENDPNKKIIIEKKEIKPPYNSNPINKLKNNKHIK